MDNWPKITVITVTFNAREFIAETIESIINQTYPAVEYIVIDGKSTDGTQDIVHGYSQSIDRFVSEPDEGTYDAMNKGIDFATGEWIIFINAGDYFVNRDTLANVFSADIDHDCDFIYGDHIWKDGNMEKRVASRPLHLMWQRISFSHQSLLARTSLMKDKKFNLNYKIVSDYHFYFNCYMEGYKFCKVKIPISVFRAGGLSNVNFLQRTYERWHVVKQHKKGIKVHLYYLQHLFLHLMKKKLLG